MSPNEIRVVAAVVQRADKYMVCQRPWTKRHGGLWEFPGGKIEGSESDSDALARELLEELGVTVTRVDRPHLSLRDPNSPFLIVFLPVEITGEPSPHEHLDLRWASIYELARFDLAPSDRAFVNHLVRCGQAADCDGLL